MKGNKDYRYILEWTKRRGALNPVVSNLNTFFCFVYREEKCGVEEPLKTAWEQLDRKTKKTLIKELKCIFKEYKKERKFLGVEK